MDVLKASTRKPRRLGKKGAAELTHAARWNLIQDIQEIEHRAHDLGMTVTGHALNNAKNAAGWELADNTEMAGKAARGERAGE